jgi:hypothetical protein
MLGGMSVLVSGCDGGSTQLEACKKAMQHLPERAPADPALFSPKEWDETEELCRELAESKSDLAPRGREQLAELTRRRTEMDATISKQRKASEARAKTAREERTRMLRQKIRPKWGPFTTPNEPDSRCVSEGKPPFMIHYTGSTYAENEELAYADGCVHAFHVSPNPGMQDEDDNGFCCPDPRK